MGWLRGFAVLCASVIPARGTAAIDPMQALRSKRSTRE
jgi:hypothetical protein